MRNPFRKKDSDFLLEVQKNLEAQMGFEHVGQEESVDIVVDPLGSIQDLGGERSGIVSDVEGTPHVYKQRISRLLDCGHMVHSREQILGQCSYGHTVCTLETLYTCGYCRAKLCDKDVIIWTNGSTTCDSRKCKRKWRKWLRELKDWEERNEKKAVVPDIFKFKSTGE